jgi:hypothetical protein
MTLHRLCAPAVLVGLLAVSGGAVLAADEAPSGSVTIDETQVMALVGGSTGSGKLIYNGKTYGFSVEGAKLGGLGIQKTHVTGEVYHLNDVADFSGKYVSAEAGAALVKGLQGEWMANEKGVKLHMHADAEGVALSGGLEGVTITLD